MIYEVIDGDGKVVAELDDADSCSGSRTGAVSEMCGGCGCCLLAQAAYSGFTIREKIIDTVRRFDAESFCVVHCRPNSGIVQMTSNIADAELAKRIADEIRDSGGHVFNVVPAGVLVAALKLVKKVVPQ